jgi:hypothetical protein
MLEQLQSEQGEAGSTNQKHPDSSEDASKGSLISELWRRGMM